MHLLQIAGGQSWPNLLPILALGPSRVTFFTSSDPVGEYRKSIQAIVDACYSLGVTFSHDLVATSSKNPTTKECRDALAKLAPCCINLTGGTKPMSIAAYDRSLRGSIPAFYLDTRRKDLPAEAVNAAGCALKDQLNEALPAIFSRITVPIALKANGFPVPTDFKNPPESWTNFAVRAAQLRMDAAADKEIGKSIGQLRVQLMGQNSTMPRKAELRAALQRPVQATVGTPWHEYLIAASETGIIQKADLGATSVEDFFLLHDDPVTANAESLRSKADQHFKLLEGVWFELALLEHLRKKTSFSDICWSVEADRHLDPAASSRGETDLVAFNTINLSLHFISCKTTGPHGSALDHIQGLRGRATKEGGQFAKAELWIFRAKSDDHRRDLENHCMTQSVALRIYSEELVDKA
jgi:hypothetical protein